MKNGILDKLEKTIIHAILRSFLKILMILLWITC